jgi:hypothetical protein
VFKCLPFLPLLMMSVVSVMVPYVWPVSDILLEYPELLLLFLIARICSLYLILKVLPVWPIYFNGQSRHLIWYMPLLYLSVLMWCLSIFSSVFCVLSCVSLKILVIHLTSFPQYVKVAHFVFCFGSLHALCFCNCNCTFSSRFVLYSFLYSILLTMCFACVVIEYVCSQFNRNLILDSLCWYWWHELLGVMITSVKVLKCYKHKF